MEGNLGPSDAPRLLSSPCQSAGSRSASSRQTSPPEQHRDRVASCDRGVRRTGSIHPATWGRTVTPAKQSNCRLPCVWTCFMSTRPVLIFMMRRCQMRCTRPGPSGPSRQTRTRTRHRMAQACAATGSRPYRQKIPTSMTFITTCSGPPSATSCRNQLRREDGRGMNMHRRSCHLRRLSQVAVDPTLGMRHAASVCSPA